MNRTFRPAPKISRIVDREAVDYVRTGRDGRCMIGLARPGQFGPCSAGKDVHHIDHRGAGGDDTRENMITLCRRHHQLAHAGAISKEELRGILSQYYHYEYP